MAYSNVLKVKQQDLYIYEKLVTRNSKIYKFWRYILKKMPAHLLKEVRQNPTYLIKDEQSEVYFFVTANASDALTKYLNSYMVLIEE